MSGRRCLGVWVDIYQQAQDIDYLTLEYKLRSSSYRGIHDAYGCCRSNNGEADFTPLKCLHATLCLRYGYLPSSIKGINPLKDAMCPDASYPTMQPACKTSGIACHPQNPRHRYGTRRFPPS